MDSNPGKTSTENIDEVILRLLKLETGTELDYQIYAKKLKIKLASSRMVGAFIPAEEDILLREEFKRVRNKEGRFVILKSKKTKVSSPPPPSPNEPNNPEDPPKTSTIVKAPPSGKITTEKLFNTPRVEPVNVKDITPDKSSQVDPLIRISDILDSILETLTNINNFDREQSTRQRTDAENKRRSQRETDLESKPFEGIKKALSAITKPFQSIWDRIVNFITNVILGRIVIKLLDWLANPKNQEKAKAIIRFLGDWWPALLGSYVLFGTTFGKFIRGATGMVGRFILHIGKVAIPQLLKFIKTPLGAGIALFTAGATIPAMFPGTVNEQERKTTKAPGSTEDKIKALQQQKANLNVFEKLQGKGSEIDEQISLLETGKTKSYGFSGGGFANFGNMFKGAGMGSMFGPMGMLAGAALGSGKPQEMFNGFVSGQSGVDKVPAMLTDGEFVMSTGAVQKYGVDTLESMNAAGGGTNKPKIMGGKTYAVGGGLIGETPKEIKLRKAYEYKLGKDLISKLTNKQISEISKYYNSLPDIESTNIDSQIIKGFKNPLKDMAEKMISGVPHTGGGLVGNVPYYSPGQVSDASMRKFADRFSGTLKIPADEIYKSFKTHGYPKFDNIIGTKDFDAFQGGAIDGDNPGAKGILDKMRDAIKRPQSFTQSSRSASGLDDLSKRYDLDAKTAPRYAENLPKLNTPKPTLKLNRPNPTPKLNTPTSTLKPKIPTFASELSPSYFLRGQSSALPENYFSRSPINSNPIGNWTDVEKRLLGINDQSVFDRSQLDASRSTPKINSNSSFNRYRPGATLRATGPGMQNFPELQRFAGQSGTMKPNSPRIGGGLRGIGGSTLVGGLKSAGVELLANYLMERGFDKVNAMIIANKIDEGEKLTGDKKENYIQRLKGVIEREERWQKGFGGVFDSIIGMGKESSSKKLSKNARAILEGIGSSAYQGGGIKGGYGLKEQSFKDAPKTQIMTDDKGRPFVGHKALKNGKIVYVKGAQPGQGTSNIFERLGRSINPGAYKDNDAKLARQKHKEAMVNSLEGFQKQGMAPDAQARMMKQMGGNLKDVQNDLNYRNKPKPKLTRRQEDIEKYKASMSPRYTAANISSSQRRRTPNITPLPRPKPKPIVAGTGGSGRRGSGSKPSSGSNSPSFNAQHSKGTRTHKETLGIMR